MMDDARLAHLCKLASVKAFCLAPDQDSRTEWIQYIEGAGRSDLHNEYNCLSIMAEAFVELMNRAGMKPSFRVPAGAKERTP